MGLICQPLTNTLVCRFETVSFTRYLTSIHFLALTKIGDIWLRGAPRTGMVALGKGFAPETDW